jgi:hypothetical protein
MQLEERTRRLGLSQPPETTGTEQDDAQEDVSWSEFK